MTTRCLWICTCGLLLWTGTGNAQLQNAQQSSLDRELIMQSGNGNTDDVAALLEQGANPNASNSAGFTPLHRAASGGHVEVMRLLIDRGADLHAKRSDGSTILRAAAGSHESNAVGVLLAAGVEPDGGAMGLACWLGRDESVDLLLDAGASPDVGLARAAQGGHVELVRLLLDRGADVNGASGRGNSPLHLAALQGGFETVELLLNDGANPNALNEEDETPLHMAISGDGDIRRVKLLVESGASLDIANKEGVTPVRLAGIHGAKPIYDWLLAQSGGTEPQGRISQDGQEALAGQSVDKLIAQFLSDDREKRLAAQRHLAMRGAETMPAVLRHIETGASIDRFYELFQVMGPHADAALPELEKRLAMKEHALAAALTIERMRPGQLTKLSRETLQEASRALYEATIDPNADVMAGFSLGFLVRIGEPATPQLLQLLRSDKAGLRLGASRQLAKALFSSEAIESELSRLAREDEDLAVRAAAADALGNFAGQEEKAKAALLSIIEAAPPRPDSRTTGTREHKEFAEWRRASDRAARSLAQFGPDVVDDLVPYLSPLDAPQRPAAITALQSIGEPAVPRLIELLAHDDEVVALSASMALGRIGRTAVDALTETVRDGDAGQGQLTQKAATALWLIGPAATEAVPSLLRVAGSDAYSDVSRLMAIRAALKIDKAATQKSTEVATVIPVLIRILEEGKFRHQGWAAEALGDIGPAARDALPVLRRKLEPPGEEVDTGYLIKSFVQTAAKDAIAAIEADSPKATENP